MKNNLIYTTKLFYLSENNVIIKYQMNNLKEGGDICV